MITETVAEERARPVPMSEDIDHLICECSPDVSLCGLDVSGVPIVDDDNDDDLCLVCEDLEHIPCVVCGFCSGGDWW